MTFLVAIIVMGLLQSAEYKLINLIKIVTYELTLIPFLEFSFMSHLLCVWAKTKITKRLKDVFVVLGILESDTNFAKYTQWSVSFRYFIIVPSFRVLK